MHADRKYAPGTMLDGRYRILSHLGTGGMGSVYRAEQVGTARSVAIKVIEGILTSGEAGARFDREARTAAMLDHPGCVRVLDYGRTAYGRRFLVMELLHGPSLAAVLEAGALTPARAIRIGTEILEGLGHAHRAGVLHRDLKPENVMYTRRDGRRRVVLIDFGLARLLDDNPLTAVGFCVGSPSYMAPERLLASNYDARADLYSVGVLLFEMLAGFRPFVGPSPTEIARQQIECPPPPLSPGHPQIPWALESLVRRALAKDPARRFSSADEMSTALGAIAADSEMDWLPPAARGYEPEETPGVTRLSLTDLSPCRRP